MFRRLMTWLAGHWVGPAPTTPEEAAAMKLYEAENFRLRLLGGELTVELTAAETKVFHLVRMERDRARLPRLGPCDDPLYEPCLLVWRSMTRDEQDRAVALLGQARD